MRHSHRTMMFNMNMRHSHRTMMFNMMHSNITRHTERRHDGGEILGACMAYLYAEIFGSHISWPHERRVHDV